MNRAMKLIMTERITSVASGFGIPQSLQPATQGRQRPRTMTKDSQHRLHTPAVRERASAAVSRGLPLALRRGGDRGTTKT